ncbi:MAG: AmmeMemoRadiSam system protein A [Candidatus Anammoxibacter sp.]
MKKRTAIYILISTLIIIIAPPVIFFMWFKVWENVEHRDLLSLEEDVRKATAAGKFYPEDEAELKSVVDSLMDNVNPVGIRNVKILLVPHDQYIYSGEVAARSFKEVKADFKKVFLLASNRNAALDFKGVSVADYLFYSVPGYNIPVNKDIVEQIREDAGIAYFPEAHKMHMLEVALPFLLNLKSWEERAGFSIIPMILGRMDALEVERFASVLKNYADKDTLFVMCVNLSGSHTEGITRQMDELTIESILSMDDDAISDSVTDGNQVLLTMNSLARELGLRPTRLQYGNSGDDSGGSANVVGYASIVFHDPIKFDEKEEHALLELARSSIEDFVLSGKIMPISESMIKDVPILNLQRATFVTLKKDKRLRGCIGDLVARTSLYEGIRKNAIMAATRDPRFPPVGKDELDSIDLSISILTHPRRIKLKKNEDLLKVIRPGIDGVIIEFRGRRSTYLPVVWEDLRSPAEFVSRLCLKQGSPADCWKDADAKIYFYEAIEIGNK